MTLDPVALCTQTIQHHSKSFAFASKLLPPGHREETVVLYHWCRRADDMVDDAGVDQDAAVRQLSYELGSIYAGERQEDIALAAAQSIVQRRAIPRYYMAELIEGMAMDARSARYHSLEDLLVYCYRVAGTVGLMMSHVLGVSSPQALRHAAHMGIGMQITNICRDVMEDWQRHRLYLPIDWVREEIGEDPIPYLSGAMPERFREPIARVVQRLLYQADAFYRSGDRGLKYLDWRSALAVRTARYVYSAIGNEVRALECDPAAGRAHVPKGVKLLLGVRALAAAAIEAPIRALRGREAVSLEAELARAQDVIPRDVHVELHCKPAA